MSGLVLGQKMQVKRVLGDVDSHNVLQGIPLPCIYEFIGYNGSG